MRVILAANESIGYKCFKILLEENQEVIGIITDKTNNLTKLKNMRIKLLANQAGVMLYQPENINDPDFLKELRLLNPDILFNIAFVQIYKSPILSIPRLGCINFHPGPLPIYGGSNGWVWAIINGESEYGVVFHYMKEKIDTGDIIALEKFPIEKHETGLSLIIKCYKYGAPLFRKTLRNILEGTAVPTPQDLTKRSYYYNKIPYDGIIDVRWSARKIENFVRAMSFSPFPNPLSPPMVKFNNIKLIITEARVLARVPEEKNYPGEVTDITSEGVIMQAGDGFVLLGLSEHTIPTTDTLNFCASKGIQKGSILGG